MTDEERFAAAHPEHVRRVLGAGDPAHAPADGLAARLYALVVDLIGHHGEVEVSPWEAGELLGERDYASIAVSFGELIGAGALRLLGHGTVSVGVGPSIWCDCGGTVEAPHKRALERAYISHRLEVHGERVPGADFTTPAGRTRH